ncbi:ribosome biogenesis protein YTM1 [Coccidioides immitis RS]|uniref:Ribosome biogenesis protein YTM1 n=1 Tax=Coccidioides immitis (strain RS) TaxID=246410 RepID=A0A0D8JVQ5_COCIM|nr:ribosome biogenesis protein YTM1 [Coccidioides immitis RS]KJF61392.1 ribosome biogenesis protein YTM1 [Coccidioides immitis RS]
MASSPSSDAICQALLRFITDGKFPDSEDLVSTEFPLEIIPTELQEITTAKKEIENEISTLSRETATNIDDWIVQAKKLHQDIERSRLTAREIVTLHEKGRALRDRVSDAQSAVDQLHEDIVSNEAILETLGQARLIDNKLANAQLALDRGEWIRSIDLLDDIGDSLASSKLPQSSNIVGLLSTKVTQLHAGISNALRAEWSTLIKIDATSDQPTITIHSSDHFPDILAGLTRLQVLDDVVSSFQKDLINYILRPVIFPVKTGQWRIFSVDGNCLRLVLAPSRPLLSDLLNSILSAFSYLKENLPSNILECLFTTLAGTIVSPLTTKWLSPSVPSEVSSLEPFQGTLDRIHRFVSDLEKQGWQGLEGLGAWVGQVPRLWLSQRRSKALNDVRLAMSHSTGKIRKVERIEKQHVSGDNGMLVEGNGEDDWNAEWSDNEDEDTLKSTTIKTTSEETENQADPGNEDDADESWDWDDDNEEPPAAAQPEASSELNSQAKGHGGDHKDSQRELILKEYYAVTDLPDRILTIISNQVADAEDLTNLGSSQLKLASSRPALLALPTLIVAMFKATAPVLYSHRFDAGQMHLYNDCMYLAEKLRSFSEAQNLPKLSSDVESIEKFGKAAYGKELQSQRTILSDLLDGCQGFSTCSEEPFLGECKNAMAAAVDRVRDVYKEWQPILSRSALLQSMGRLISAAINKLILDIEDLSDISDAESRRLAEFCTSLSNLEDLFLPDPSTDPNAANQPEAIPMTAMYVPNWLKFQYLINILESSLADIKYMWTEGELKLEFDVDELVDLIKALFADSDHRKRAIAEIRRTAGVS